MKALVDYVHKIIVIESILIQFDALYCARGTDNVKSPLADERGTNGPFRPIHTRTLTHTHTQLNFIQQWHLVAVGEVKFSFG